MTIIEQAIRAFNGARQLSRLCTDQHIASVMDLTCLNIDATETDIHQLATKGIKYAVAALCVYPKHLQLIPDACLIKRATVVNFPTGNTDTDTVIKEIEDSLPQKICEIDYVLPYQSYLSGRTQNALLQAKIISDVCKQHGLTFKVIIETGSFSSLEVLYTLCRELIDLGSDFLKTSTGKTPIGATPETVFTLLKAIKDSGTQCGVKCSGGIASRAIAANYFQLATFSQEREPDESWFRIGASKLLDELNLLAH